MKNIVNHILLLGVLIVILSGCDVSRSATVNKQYSATAQPTIDTKLNEDVNSNQTNTVDDENSYECVRAIPEPIIKKEVFPKTNFRLVRNKEYPHEYLGFETVEFENGDKLLIENIGCENFTWNFRFETDRFSGKMDDTEFWYKKAAELITQTRKGINDESNRIDRGIKALNSYIKKDKKLKFDEEIDFGGDDIRDVVMLDKVKKLKDGKVEIVLSFGTGPL